MKATTEAPAVAHTAFGWRRREVAPAPPAPPSSKGSPSVPPPWPPLFVPLMLRFPFPLPVAYP